MPTPICLGLKDFVVVVIEFLSMLIKMHCSIPISIAQL
jgi:hypothetical protein